MRRLALALVLVAPLVARSEEPSFDAIPETEIVAPHMHRHVIGAPEEAKPQPAAEPSAPANEEPAPAPVVERGSKSKKGRKDAKAEKNDPAASKKAKKTADLTSLVPDAPVDTGYTPPSEQATPDLDAEPQIARPSRSRAVISDPTEDAPTRPSRPVVTTPAPTETEEVEATRPVKSPVLDAVTAAEPERTEVPEAALSTEPQPMRHVRMGLGLAMVGLMGANLATTQLDHADRFLGYNTQRYTTAHHATEYATFGAFGVLGLVELLSEDSQSTVHQVGFTTALVATAAQAGLLIATEAREGYADQMGYSRAHLAASWTAAVGMALSSIALAF